MSTFKSVDQAVIEMLRYHWWATGTLPDSTPGSNIRTMYEAAGFQIEDLSSRFDIALSQAIPEAAFAAFGFALEPGAKAQTGLTFSSELAATQNIPIPAGTVVATATGIEFATQEAATLQTGETSVEVGAQAVTVGTVGNVPASSLTTLRQTIAGINSVTNLSAATGGSDVESGAARYQRFAAYTAALAKGTPQALAAIALAQKTEAGEHLDAAKVADLNTDPSLDPASAYIYCYQRGGIGADLMTLLQTALSAAVSSGIQAVIRTVPPTEVKVIGTVASNSAAALTAAQQAMENYVAGLGIGESVNRNNLITRLTDAYPDIDHIILGTPPGDVVIATYGKAELSSSSSLTLA